MEYAQGIKRERDDHIPNSPVSRNDTSCKAKRPKLERTFVSAWLDRYDWLRYDEELNVMFCDLCMKHRKSNAFTEGCQNFRRDNLNKHANTNDHRASLEQNYAGIMSGLVSLPNASLNGSIGVGSVVPLAGSNRSSLEFPPASLSSTKSTPSPRRSSISSGSETSINAGRSMQSPLDTEPTSTPSPTPAHMPLSQNYLAGLRAFSAIHRPQPMLPGELNGHISDKEELPIVPSYLNNPVFPYASQLRQKPVQTESPMNLSLGSSTKKCTDRARTNCQSVGACGGSSDNELVLKVRVAHSAETDFIEIEMDMNNLTFDDLLTTMCQELGVTRKLVYKVRKLPDTIIRKDKDVKRLTNFQEMELVLTNKAISDRLSDNAKNYTPSVSPKHVDVVY